MTYPVGVSRVHMESKDGRRSNKFYELLLVRTASDRTLLIRRWGKIGAFGDIKEELYESGDKAERAFEKVFKEKTGKGYHVTKQADDHIVNDQQWRGTIGIGLWPKLSAKAVNFLDPNIDTSGRRRMADDPLYGEDGSYQGRQSKPSMTQEELAKLREEEKRKERETAYQANPLFGAF